MLEILHDLFSYTFIVRALIVGTLVSLCAALLGVSLVLKRYSMIGDGLSHVGFGALAVAMAFHWAPFLLQFRLLWSQLFFIASIKRKQQNKRGFCHCIDCKAALLQLVLRSFRWPPDKMQMYTVTCSEAF